MDSSLDYHSEPVVQAIGTDTPRSSWVREYDLTNARVSLGTNAGVTKLLDIHGNRWLVEPTHRDVRFYLLRPEGGTHASRRMSYAQFRSLFVW
jgi:hypothetical protein